MNQFFTKVLSNLNKSFKNTGIPLEARLLNTEIKTLAVKNSTETLELFKESASKVEDILDGASAAVLFVDDFIPAESRKIMIIYS